MIDIKNFDSNRIRRVSRPSSLHQFNDKTSRYEYECDIDTDWLRAGADVSVSDISMLANIVVGGKVKWKTGNQASLNALMHMFVELFVVRELNDSSETSSSSFNLAAPDSSRWSEPIGVTRAIDLTNRHGSSRIISRDPSIHAMAAMLHCLRTIYLSIAIKGLVVRNRSGPKKSGSRKQWYDEAPPSIRDIVQNPMKLCDTIAYLQSYDRSYAS